MMERKKAIILNGSPRKEKSHTLKVTKAFVRGISEAEPLDAEFVNIADADIKPCTGCLSCWGVTDGECVIKDDDIAEIKQKILEADYVIESFPLYFFGMPGIMKVFTDRMLGMLDKYEGQPPPKDGESFNGIRRNGKSRKFVIISSCAYTDASEVYKSLLAQFDCICGKSNYTALFCPQLQTLSEFSTRRLERYYADFENAGKLFASDPGAFSSVCASLKKPPFSEETYKILLDKFWQMKRQGKT